MNKLSEWSKVNKRSISAYALIVLLIIGSFFVGSASAAPQVLPISSATVFVTNGDYIQFAPGINVAQGANYQIIAPNQENVTYTRVGTATASACTCYTIRFYLNGVNAPSGNVTPGQVDSADQWIRSGNFSSVTPVDGTWTINIIAGTNLYGSADSNSNPGGSPGPTLFAGGKAIHFGFGVFDNPSQRLQLWNWRNTTGTWNEPSSVPITNPTAVDSPNESAEEDPNNAVFFQSTPVNNNQLTAHTLQSSVTCANNTVIINGAWLNANSSANTSFIYVAGNFLGTTDLRTIPLAITTTEQNQGNVSSGLDNETIPYSDSGGTSYQFRVRTLNQGEALGFVSYVAPQQCTSVAAVINLTDVHAVDTFDLSVSNAQCNGDPVAFAADINIGNALSVIASVTLTVYDAATNTTVYSSSTWFTVGNRVQFQRASFPTGSYAAIAKLVITGVAAGTFYQSEAFAVPRGDCSGLATDLTPLIGIVSNINNTVVPMNTNVSEIANDTDYILANQTVMNNTLNNHTVLLNAINNTTVNTNTIVTAINGTVNLINGTVNTINGTLNFVNGTTIAINGIVNGIATNLTIINNTLNNHTVLLNNINATTIAINGTVNSINGTVSFINSTTVVMNGTLNFVNSTVQNINGTVVNTNGVVTAMNGTVNFINGTTIEIDQDLDEVLANQAIQNNTLNNHTMILNTINGTLTYVNGTTVEIDQDLDEVLTKLTMLNVTCDSCYIDNGTLSAILQNVTDHRNNTLEIFSMNNVSVLVMMVLFLLAIAVAEWKKDMMYHLIAVIIGIYGIVTFNTILGVSVIVILAIMLYQLMRVVQLYIQGRSLVKTSPGDEEI